MLAKAITATSGVQVIIVMSSLVVPLTAVQVAPVLGLEPHLVGYYASLIYLVAAFTSLATPQWVRRYGAIRVHQIMLLVAVAGLAVLSSETLAGFILSAILIGLAYGPANPASSSLLSRYTSSGNRARVFSLKQTAVPLGGAFAGLIVPFLMARIGWLGAALTVAAIGFAGAIVIGGWRDALDRDRQRPAAGRQDRRCRGAASGFGQHQPAPARHHGGLLRRHAIQLHRGVRRRAGRANAMVADRGRLDAFDCARRQRGLPAGMGMDRRSRTAAFRAGGAWRDDGSGNHRLRLFDAVMAERSSFTPSPFCSAHRARAGTAWHSPRPPTSRRRVMSAKPPPASCSSSIPAR